ncbi:DHH family phosphoesterase [Pyrofollis japonicus]|uniref:DHH family phosphoesterase n=1 Tax=Pyrofollis japonicus TaxID=3060460 RepID=UPI00295B9AC8|nr:DHH family phosphoesterase [Pyrofollis japonicus]
MIIPEKCEQAITIILGARKVLVVHHWDADGVASAALLARRLGGRLVGTDVPRIGVYTAEAVPEPPRDALLAVLDYGIPGQEYDKLVERTNTPIAVVDHHAVEPPRRLSTYCNPVALKKGSERDYPGNSLLVYKLLGEPRDTGDRFLAALGVVGDLEAFLKAGREHPGLALAEELLKETNVSLEEAGRLARSIDSCYRLLDYSCLRYAVRRLAEDPLGALNDRVLGEALAKAEKIVEKALGSLEKLYKDEAIAVYWLSLDAYVTSAIGRRLAAENPDKVMVLAHYMPREKRGYVYIRSVSKELVGLARFLRERGVKPGGKTNVVVVEFSNKDQAEEIINAITSYLRGDTKINRVTS